MRVTIRNFVWCLSVVSCLLLAMPCAGAASRVQISNERRINFNDSWRFFKGEAEGAEPLVRVQLIGLHDVDAARVVDAELDGVGVVAAEAARRTTQHGDRNEERADRDAVRRSVKEGHVGKVARGSDSLRRRRPLGAHSRAGVATRPS